jgi:fructoselysine 6-kinase
VVGRAPGGRRPRPAGAHFAAAAAAILPVDTCGAGDSYIAAFIAAHVEGATIPAALAAGTRSATQTCLHLGGFRQRTAPIPAWLAEQCARQIADR